MAGALALSGCSDKDRSQYHFNGKIGEDQVEFFEKKPFLADYDYNIMVVKRADGRTIRYVDRLNDDLKLEYVEITDGDKTQKYYPNNEVGKPVLEEAQKQFDNYLAKIVELRTQEGLENLK